MIAAMFLRRLACGVLILLVSACWGVKRPETPAREVALGVSINSFTLDNGLRVVVVDDPRATDATVTLRYGVGEIDDPAGEEGTAHLVEHVLFEPVVDGRSIFEYLRQDAYAFNGTTTLDATSYEARVPASELAALLALETARLEHRCETVSDAAFARQREIVRNELREHADQLRLKALLEQALYPAGHAYHRAANDSLESVAAITKEHACAFADAHYAPNNASIVIAGRLDENAARQLLAKTLATSQRKVAPRPPAEVAAVHGTFELTAPIDGPLVLVAWPLPASPVDRASSRAVVQMFVERLRGQVDGGARVVELGGSAAPVIAIAITPGAGASFTKIRDALDRTRLGFSQWFGTGMFERARERARYDLLASLEPAAGGNTQLAQLAFLEADVQHAVTAELAQVSTLGRGAAGSMSSHALDLSNAAILLVSPETAQRRGRDVPVGDPVDSIAATPGHDDPAEATRPAAGSATPPTQVRVRTLANGLRVVLLPLSTMPTVEVRLSFDAGLGDEPTSKPGIATLAANALDPPNDPAIFTFWTSGSELDVDVDLDHTAFIARGLAGNLDILLRGLDLTVRDGDYDALATSRSALSGRFHAAELAAVVAWREAIYGHGHPYARAALVGDAALRKLAADDLHRFRAAHYVPSRATVIIAGGFDPAVADHWIEYVFGAWNGDGTAPRPTATKPQPYAFAQTRDTSQIALQIAWPLSTTDHAGALIAAEMVDAAVTDVREQLAASYGLDAGLLEARASTLLAAAGYVDAARGGEALRLVGDRLARLRAGDDETASRFVAARRRVLTKLGSPARDPHALAELAQREIDVGRDPAAVAALLDAVRAATLPRVMPTLRDLDLAQASLLVRGPTAAVRAAYQAIGRDPVFIGAAQ